MRKKVTISFEVDTGPKQYKLDNSSLNKFVDTIVSHIKDEHYGCIYKYSKDDDSFCTPVNVKVKKEIVSK